MTGHVVICVANVLTHDCGREDLHGHAVGSSVYGFQCGLIGGPEGAQAHKAHGFAVYILKVETGQEIF